MNVTRAPIRIGQHDTDGTAERGLDGQTAAQHARAEHQAAIGQRLAQDVLDDCHAAAEAGACIQEGREQGAARVGGLEGAGFHHRLQHRADGPAAGAAEQRRVDGDRDRRQHRHGEGREPGAPDDAAEAGQLGILQAIDADGHQHGAGLVGDEAGTFIDLHQGRR